jgi:hypothetical protein
VALIAIEEHWNLPELTSAVKALPEDRGDPSVVLDELGDNLERLDDIGVTRIAPTAFRASRVWTGRCRTTSAPTSTSRKEQQ